MKNILEIAEGLNERLSSFGKTTSSKSIIDKAIEENNWFSSVDICRAVEAIQREMLNKAKLTKWLANYPTLPNNKARRIAIIMAGNIPLVGIFDLICTLAAGHEAWIKPSSKDKTLMSYICSLIKEIEPSTPIYIYDDTLEYDAVIATGGESANTYFEQRFKETKRLCRSSRHSVAVLSEQTTEEDLRLLAEDIYSYSGLGCRNVAMIFAPRGIKFTLPNYPTTQKYHNSYIQSRALLTISGKEFIDNGSSLIIASRELPTSLSTISLWEYDSLSEVADWIEEHDSELQCIVSNTFAHPRRVNFGEAQKPTLFDYADGVDTMKFLDF